MARKSFTWARRGVLAATLLAVALVPYPVIGSASTPAAAPCHTNCGQTGAAGKILWSRELPGTWTASGGLTGTVPVSGQAYVAVGNGVAAVGLGMDLRAYNSRTGQPQWQLALHGFPADSAIVSVRVWPGVVTAGVTYGPGGSHRAEIVINSATGQEYRWHPATPFGGAVSATAQTTVVVGPGAVTGYDTTTGRIRWRQPTGTPDQAWQADGPDLYVTVAADGYLGTEPVTALRRIDMSTGRETIVRPSASSFSGTLSGVVGNVVLFSSATGVTAYDGLTGLLMWSLAGVVPEGTDAAQGRFNLTQGTSLLAVDPLTGHVTARAPGSAVAGLGRDVRGARRRGPRPRPRGQRRGLGLRPERPAGHLDRVPPALAALLRGHQRDRRQRRTRRRHRGRGRLRQARPEAGQPAHVSRRLGQR